jgi:hypothetical protein
MVLGASIAGKAPLGKHFSYTLLDGAGLLTFTLELNKDDDGELVDEYAVREASLVE